MKRISFLTVIISVLTAVSLLLSGCGDENSQENNTANVTGTIFVDYVKSYENLGELAKDADLIAYGTIDRTETVPDESTRDGEDPRTQLRNTRATLRVEKSIKGDFTDEIIIIQTGAAGWLQEMGNPVFTSGERCFLFLRGGEDGIYGLLHPDGRFRIENDKVSSMNFVLPTGQARPPLDLTFWRIDLDKFITRIIEAVKSDIVIPDEEPVISINLLRVMGGRNDDLSIYEDGTVVFTKQWGLRHPMPDHPPMKAWRLGKIGAEDVEDLFEILESINFNGLEAHDRASDPHLGSGRMSDLRVTISANNGYIDNKVFSLAYSSEENRSQYKVYPLILNEVFEPLMRIAEEETKETYREEIERDIVYEYPDENEQ